MEAATSWLSSSLSTGLLPELNHMNGEAFLPVPQANLRRLTT